MKKYKVTFNYLDNSKISIFYYFTNLVIANIKIRNLIKENLFIKNYKIKEIKK